MADARREGDISPEKAVFGDTMKLISNSCFGSCLMSKEKFCNTTYIKGQHDVTMAINKSNFRDCCELGNDIYEVSTAYKSITVDVPIHIGLFCLQMSKLRMIMFYYNCLDKYLPRRSFALAQMDTDSQYFGLSSCSLLTAVKSQYKQEFITKLYKQCGVKNFVADSETWFPRLCCKSDMLRDSREPSLFKEEASGSKMICLNSKTYCLEQEKDSFKISCKGVSKKFVNKPMQIFDSVLSTQKSQAGQISGFLK